jgi:hypothetical protein
LRSPARSPFGWLVAKERRDLVASRAWWLTLALTGPLVGVTFTSAVRTFAEVSAGAGSACGSVCAPLDGIWGPTFGAYEIVAVFLLPFVAIRLASADRQSGALKIEAQRPIGWTARIGAKALVLLAGWIVAFVPAALAIVLWTTYGGVVHAPELLVVAAGHLINAALAMAIAMTAAAVADHPSTAAIATLGITVGTWILAFAGAIYGGWWEQAAALTPAAMVTVFQHGLLRADLVISAMAIVALGFALAGIWLPLERATRLRVRRSILAVVAAAAANAKSARVQSRGGGSASPPNSCCEAEEEALAALPGDLEIDVHLAPRDPRRLEFERRPLAKLRRVRPDVKVRYIARTTQGLYEEADPGYGEIWYSVGGRRAMSRLVTDEGVLETIFALSGSQPAEGEPEYSGDPLVAEPRWAGVVFYGAWPIAVLGAAVFSARSRR